MAIQLDKFSILHCSRDGRAVFEVIRDSVTTWVGQQLEPSATGANGVSSIVDLSA
jgi:hypothetical protein